MVRRFFGTGFFPLKPSIALPGAVRMPRCAGQRTAGPRPRRARGPIRFSPRGGSPPLRSLLRASPERTGAARASTAAEREAAFDRSRSGRQKKAKNPLKNAGIAGLERMCAETDTARQGARRRRWRPGEETARTEFGLISSLRCGPAAWEIFPRPGCAGLANSAHVPAGLLSLQSPTAAVSTECGPETFFCAAARRRSGRQPGLSTGCCAEINCCAAGLRAARLPGRRCCRPGRRRTRRK